MTFLHFNQIDSTNNYLKQNYQALKNWTVLTTDYQTSGRGRLNHRWSSNKNKNFLCSVLIKDQKILKANSCLVLLIGIVIYHLLVKLNIKNIKIKKPNDIYVNKNKIAGILLETISLGDKLKALIIGVGLNLNQKKFTKNLKAISYYQIKHKEIDINLVKKLYLEILKKELNKINGQHYEDKLLKKYQSIIYERID